MSNNMGLKFLPSCFSPPRYTRVAKSNVHVHPSSYEEGKSLGGFKRYGGSGGEAKNSREGIYLQEKAPTPMPWTTSSKYFIVIGVGACDHPSLYWRGWGSSQTLAWLDHHKEVYHKTALKSTFTNIIPPCGWI